MCYFWVEAGRGAYDCDGGIGVEAVEDASGCDLMREEEEEEESGVFGETIWGGGGAGLGMEGFTYLAAADDQHVLGLDLPGEDEAASALDLWELVLL